MTWQLDEVRGATRYTIPPSIMGSQRRRAKGRKEISSSISGMSSRYPNMNEI